MRVAVVGHVEWIQLARVEKVPAPGEIVHASEVWEEPAGGGAVAAVQLARLAGECLFITALGDDALGHRAKQDLERLGVRVEAAWRSEPQRRAFVHVDADAERTITVMGERVGPDGDDPLPWAELNGTDAVYFTAGDSAAVRRARAARKLVATVRAIAPLAKAGLSSTHWSRAQRTRANVTSPAESTRRPCSSLAPPVPRVAAWWRPTARRAIGQRRPRRVPPWTPMGRVTRLLPGLRSVSVTAVRLKRRSRSGRAAARPA